MTTDTTPAAIEALYLIRKRGYFYGKNERGYTSSAIQAGRYTLADANRITHPNGLDGPRDGMDYIHEREIIDADWQAFSALSAELTTARAERDEARNAYNDMEIKWALAISSAEKAETELAAVCLEAEKCFSAQEDIDEAWDAIGTRGNRNVLTLAEQLSSLFREEDERAEKSAFELAALRKEVERMRGDAQ